MVKKDNMKEFVIKFHGESVIKDYTEDGAKAQLENMKNIQTTRPVRTESMSYWIGQSFLENIGAIFTMFVSIIFIKVWYDILTGVQTLPENQAAIGTLVMFAVLFVMLRFPQTIGGFFDKTLNSGWNKP